MRQSIITAVLLNALIAHATCPFMDGSGDELKKRNNRLAGDDGFLDQFTVDDTDVYTTTDFGTPVSDRNSLKAGARGPTLLEDFVLRTKITRFDHERVPERAGKISNFLSGGGGSLLNNLVYSSRSRGCCSRIL